MTDETLSKNNDELEAEAAAAAAEAPATALDQTATELETLKDRHLRLQADFDNFRRRTHRERTEAQVRATEDLLRSLLPVLDHFELGLQTAAGRQAPASVVEGFQMVSDQLMAVVRQAGLVPFDAAGMFDPTVHEAISQVPSEEPADTIVAVSRRGYKLGERLFRPAQVVVSSGPAAPAEAT